MKGLQLFRAIPRPLGQYLAIGLVWPVWLALGVVEAIFPNTGATVQKHIQDGLAAIPGEGWAAIAAILVSGQWSRTWDRKTDASAAEALVEAERITRQTEE